MISLWKKYSAKEKVYEKGELKSDNSPIKIIRKCKRVEELILKILKSHSAKKRKIKKVAHQLINYYKKFPKNKKEK